MRASTGFHSAATRVLSGCRPSGHTAPSSPPCPRGGPGHIGSIATVCSVFVAVSAAREWDSHVLYPLGW